YCVYLVTLITKVDTILGQCDFRVPNVGA
ncbi:MAG: hypothetical protein RLZZ436_3132, partial [Planctomycetota bacterium]